ncbi:hypothetical protein K1719_037103 [Acacia pycnantha]|nr:hypothetical protein K1719_037103 [Acacia pycnantha]
MLFALVILAGVDLGIYGVWISTERGATDSPVAMFLHTTYHFQRTLKLSISWYGAIYGRFSVLNQLMQNALIQEGKEMTFVLYTYRSCVKALPQVYVEVTRCFGAT